MSDRTTTALQAETAAHHHWSCSACKFTTRSINAAVQHCEEHSGDYPAHEHTLHELESNDPPPTRNRAKRVIYCRDHFGRCQRAHIARSRWRYIDGRWELMRRAAA